MRLMTSVLCSLALSCWISATAFADSGDISSVIERFVAKRFPQAQSHFWVVNNTEWGAEDEVVVDIHAIVRHSQDAQPTEERFLLLIVAGKLVATQSVPLGAKIECKAEDIV